MRLALSVWTVWILSLAVTPASGQIVGAWSAESYVLKDGTALEVSGLIFFAQKDWSVLFFVKDEQGTVRRGSGEGGTYELEADRLTFTHFYHLSAGEEVGTLPPSPLRMNVSDAAEAATEPCVVDVGEESMTIHFPSGNRMAFTRSSGF